VDTEHRQNPPLPEGQYYHHQLLGLHVVTTGGKSLGTISEILPGQSNDNYIVAGPRGQVLIPAIEDVIQSVDLNKGEMVIEPLPGLLDLNEKKPPQ
jgi:16S rRNA processing protein RimM